MDSEEPESSRKRPEPQATSAYGETSEAHVQKSIILLESSSLEQVSLKCISRNVR